MNMPITTTLIFLLVCLTIYSAYFIYKNETIDRFLAGKLFLYFVFIVLLLFKLNYYKNEVGYGEPPDEVVHYSYVEYVKNNDKVIPEFENMFMYNNPKSGNYLGHPPLYYRLLSLDVHKEDTLKDKIEKYRNISILMALLSFFLMATLSFPQKIHVVAHLVYLTTISSIPMFAYLGASINNDNLANLGGVIFIIGLARFLNNEKNANVTFFFLGCGFFISFFGKFTAALLALFSLISLFIYYKRTKKDFRITQLQIVILLIFLIPVAYYQIYILLKYHSLLPSYSITHPQQYLTSGFWIPEHRRIQLNPYEWLLYMRNFVIKGWFGILSHHSVYKSSIFDYLGLLTLHSMAVLCLLFKHEKGLKTFSLVGKITLISFFCVMVIQYFYSYHNHLSTGYLGGLQPRYLLPFMASYAILASLFVNRFSRSLVLNICISAICAHALYSDIFYFIGHYH